MSDIKQLTDTELAEAVANKGGYKSCCNHCKYLNPQEEDQTELKELHICSLFNIQVYHTPNAHPYIHRPDACLAAERSEK